jgi:hypothetical protein
MSARPPCRRMRALIRASQRSRSEQEFLGRAYELALPILRRRLPDQSSAKPRPPLGSFPVPQKLVGG